MTVKHRKILQLTMAVRGDISTDLLVRNRVEDLADLRRIVDGDGNRMRAGESVAVECNVHGVIHKHVHLRNNFTAALQQGTGNCFCTSAHVRRFWHKLYRCTGGKVPMLEGTTSTNVLLGTVQFPILVLC